MALDPVIKVGSRLRDNDPRMRGRTVEIVELRPNGVIAKDASGREREYLSHRIFVDNKARKYGMNLVYTLSCTACLYVGESSDG